MSVCLFFTYLFVYLFVCRVVCSIFCLSVGCLSMHLFVYVSVLYESLGPFVSVCVCLFVLCLFISVLVCFSVDSLCFRSSVGCLFMCLFVCIYVFLFCPFLFLSVPRLSICQWTCFELIVCQPGKLLQDLYGLELFGIKILDFRTQPKLQLLNV